LLCQQAHSAGVAKLLTEFRNLRSAWGNAVVIRDCRGAWDAVAREEIAVGVMIDEDRGVIVGTDLGSDLIVQSQISRSGRLCICGVGRGVLRVDLRQRGADGCDIVGSV